MLLAFFLFLQVIPQLPMPDLQPMAGEIVGPYIFREDVGQTTKVILKNGLTVLVREENAVLPLPVAAHRPGLPVVIGVYRKDQDDGNNPVPATDSDELLEVAAVLIERDAWDSFRCVSACNQRGFSEEGAS